MPRCIFHQPGTPYRGHVLSKYTLISELSPGKGAFTVAAAHKTLEGIIAQIPFRILLAAPDDCLSQLKLFLADNGFVHPFDDDPFLFLLRNSFPRTYAAGFSLVADRCPCVNIARQDLVDHRGRPAYLFAHAAILLLVRMFAFEILPGRRDIIIVQTESNL